MYQDYKGTRSPMADELRIQMPLGREFVQLAGGTVIGLEGWEADDILGTIGRWAEQHQADCIIATGAGILCSCVGYSFSQSGDEQG